MLKINLVLKFKIYHDGVCFFYTFVYAFSHPQMNDVGLEKISCCFSNVSCLIFSSSGGEQNQNLKTNIFYDVYLESDSCHYTFDFWFCRPQNLKNCAFDL